MSWLRRVFGRDPSARAERMAGAGHTLIVDGESVDCAEDYIPLVRAIAGITNGALAIDDVTCDEEDGEEAVRVLTLTRGGRTWTGRLQGSTDWIDQDALLDVLNRALADLGSPGQLHPFREENWGQELGIVFARDDELPKLRAAGFLLEDDPLPEPRPDEELAADRYIHGELIVAGAKVEYWRDPPFDEMQVTLGVAQQLGAIMLPAGTTVLYREDGAILCAVIRVPHAIGPRSFVAGTRIPFERGTWQFDQAEAGYAD
ncbi:MAG: hypothetical protein H6Q90_4005 [Deltaproteobacteria bacterium]|nr:hypothetical protein [Deltaproteobacteria bacterium]